MFDINSKQFKDFEKTLDSNKTDDDNEVHHLPESVNTSTKTLFYHCNIVAVIESDYTHLMSPPNFIHTYLEFMQLSTRLLNVILQLTSEQLYKSI